MAKRILAETKITPLVSPPLGAEITIRAGDGKRLLFVINHTDQPKTVDVPSGQRELLTETLTQKQIELDRYGVAVAKMD